MISISDMSFAYNGGPFQFNVPSLLIEPNKHVAIVGPSGCGKTTLLHLIAGILVPDGGTITVNDQAISQLPEHMRRNFRITEFGMIFQEFELLEYLTVRENILLPYRINRSLKLTADARKRADQLADSLGIAGYLNRRPKKLSQGERQRVGIARALVTQPQMILADEPTGNLDPETTNTIVQLILDQATQRQATVLMVTHDHSMLDRFDQVIDVGELG